MQRIIFGVPGYHMANCFYCGRTGFKDNIELAKHIVASKSGHRKSKAWASKVLLNVRLLDRKGNLPERSSATDEERQALSDTRKTLKIELSGEMEVVDAGCPSCKQPHQIALPVEFVRSEFAWKTRSGMFITRCTNCQG